MLTVYIIQTDTGWQRDRTHPSRGNRQNVVKGIEYDSVGSGGVGRRLTK